ncbi:MAG: NTP transferase domain-containing protein [Oscillospiraceae bacterium]|nr:NTP transferase domain-containing protein [Oscillospiraceae bacterium]
MGDRLRIKGLILAAGLSSRMESFKPLMEINGFPMIQMTVQSLKNAGIEDICVVTGKRSFDVARIVEGLGADTVNNDNYRETDMFESVKIGIKHTAAGSDALLLLPGDMPLVSPKTIKQIISGGKKNDHVVYPSYRGKRGHPPLIKDVCYDTVVNYNGEGGLREALCGLKGSNVHVDDAAVVSDADMKAEFDVVCKTARERRGISMCICEELYEEAALPEHIRNHCRAVAGLSRLMAQRLIMNGYFLDTELCASGGALHDITKLDEPHEQSGACFLRDRGYEALARIVEAHTGFKNDTEPEFDEKTIVSLADKLIKDTKPVTVRQRYDPVLKSISEDAELRAAVMRNVKIFNVLAERFQRITGIAPEKLA